MEFSRAYEKITLTHSLPLFEWQLTVGLDSSMPTLKVCLGCGAGFS